MVGRGREGGHSDGESTEGMTMKKSVAFLTAMVLWLYLAGAASAQDEPSLILQCIGYNPALKGAIEFYVEFRNPGRATLNGQQYAVSETPTHYRLDGPLGDWLPAGLEPPPRQISINRVTGVYVVLETKNMLQAFEWSRPEDQGCVTARQRF